MSKKSDMSLARIAKILASYDVHIGEDGVLSLMTALADSPALARSLVSGAREIRADWRRQDGPGEG